MHRHRRRHLAPCTVHAGASVLSLLSWLACASDDSSGAGTNSSCDSLAVEDGLGWLQENVFTPTCGTSDCHPATDAARAGLSLVDGSGVSAHAELLAPATESAAMGGARVVPGSCADSYLYRKVTGVDLGGTSRMPPFGDPLCQAEIDALCAWIEGGAIDDRAVSP